MIPLCEGCSVPPDGAIFILYAIAVLPFLALALSFAAGWWACGLFRKLHRHKKENVS